MHYFVARLLAAAEEMQDEKNNISALENVDIYGLILSMLGNCCRLLVLFFEFELLAKYTLFYRQSVERFGPRSDQYFLGSDLCPNCLQIIPAQHILDGLDGGLVFTIH